MVAAVEFRFRQAYAAEERAKAQGRGETTVPSLLLGAGKAIRLYPQNLWITHLRTHAIFNPNAGLSENPRSRKKQPAGDTTPPQ